MEATLLDEYFIAFDGSTITVESNDSQVAAFVKGTYRHMLVSQPLKSVGTVCIEITPTTVRVSGIVTLEFEGQDPEPLFWLLKEQLAQGFIRSRPDLLWLHAGAVERGGDAMVICGPSGRGKSTLATLLCERSWRLMSDDFVPLRMDRNIVLSYPQRASRRVFPGREIPANEVFSLDREIVELESHKLNTSSANLKSIIFPRFVGNGRAALTRLSQGDAALEILRNAKNFVDHKSAAVARVATMSRVVPAYTLDYSSSTEAAACLDSL